MDSVRNSNRKILGLFSNATIILICILEALALSVTETASGYSLLWTLPISYCVAITIFNPLIKKHCIYKRGFPYLVAQVVIAYRCLIVPLSCLYTEKVGGWTAYGTNGFGVEPQATSLRTATLWMCSETFFAELAILIGTMIVERKQRRKETKEYFIDKSAKDYNLGYEINTIPFLDNKFIIVLFTIVAFALLIVMQPQLFTQFMILSETYSSDNTASGSFFSVIFTAFKFSFLLLGYSYSAYKYKNTKNKFWVVFAAFFLVIYIGYSVGISRWNLILPVIASIEIFRESFKPFPKGILIGVVAVAAIGMFSVSFYKFGYLLEDDGNQIGSMIVLIFQQSNEYISGPRSVAQGLEMLSQYSDKIHLSTFFNSIFSGYAGVASLTNDADKLQSFFNFYNLGLMQDKPLICPIIIEGLGFTWLFPWTFIMIFEILAVVYDYKSRNGLNMEYRFLSCYMGLWFALCFCLNTKILMSQISAALPFLLLLYVNKKYRIVFGR